MKVRIRVKAPSRHVDNVVMLNVATKLDIPADRILTSAMASEMTAVVVLGYDRDGEEYFASSLADGGDVIWLLERAKRALLSYGDSGIESGANHNVEGVVLPFPPQTDKD